ncbi:hypothetical protein VII00023_01660 [Vibrio ichthyoenteri ATCC 700023]|uniref:Uncharacterized protein n=1 Tax=Vibrio ichthyoenteri ATCC 700023 TaxID=870968 RepID=F9RWP4_9VIBR|nr:hypothetical protein [Vibrio ichthyoenteri]EGU49102.1 hypothetical protein VII00023_01660 [Vibrio ichthyoenteri ATCC 700023]
MSFALKNASLLDSRDSRLRSFVAFGNDVISIQGFHRHPQDQGTSELGISAIFSILKSRFPEPYSPSEAFSKSFVAFGNDVISIQGFHRHPQDQGTSELGISTTQHLKKDSRLRSFVAFGNDVISIQGFHRHPQDQGTSELGISTTQHLEKDSRLRSFVAFGNDVISIQGFTVILKSEARTSWGSLLFSRLSNLDSSISTPVSRSEAFSNRLSHALKTKKPLKAAFIIRDKLDFMSTKQ